MIDLINENISRETKIIAAGCVMEYGKEEHITPTTRTIHLFRKQYVLNCMWTVLKDVMGDDSRERMVKAMKEVLNG